MAPQYEGEKDGNVPEQNELNGLLMVQFVQFHHDIYFDDKRYRAQIWNWLKY